MRHLPYFSVACRGGESHLDARGKRHGGREKGSHALQTRRKATSCPDAKMLPKASQNPASSPFACATKKKKAEMRRKEREMQTDAVRCDISRGREGGRGVTCEKRGSKKAPQIHAINNLSAPRTRREY